MTAPIRIFTIGFTQKTAQQFFELLRSSGAQRVVDVRLNNESQLAGFSKRRDLEYFLKQIVGIDYVHLPELAPTQSILDAYKKHRGDWGVYEAEFMNLMEKRGIENTVPRETIDQGCLLCSEHKPHHCHRRLVAEYLAKHWNDVETKHLIGASLTSSARS
jgi:uncharacterized protein (DUF488 family)